MAGYDWVEANGISMRCELAGSGTQTVVLMHELGGAMDSWDELMPGFQQHFRTLRYDQRGFGHSEKTRGTLSIDVLADDLAALVDRLGIAGPVHVAGTAMGAGIAIAFAARHPSRVARMVVASPATGASPEYREKLELRASTIEREGMRSYVEQSLALSYPEVLRGNRDRFERYRARWLCNDPWGFAAINRMVKELDLAPAFARVACPTLVIGCRHDTIRPPEGTRRVAEAIPGARYVEVDSGHFMAVQTPELFLEHAVPFLLGR